MTSPDSAGALRPLRVAGLALLGVAAVALVIGLITVFGSGDDDGGDNAEPPATTSESRGEPTTSTEQTSTEQPPTTSSRAPTTTSAPSTSTTSGPAGSESAPAPPGGDGNGEPGRTQPVRVYNNSTIKGLATQAERDLKAEGWHVVEVGNYSGGTIPTTTAYYRPGTAEEAAARQLATDFGMRVKPRFTGITDFPPGVLVIVTNDFEGAAGGGKNEG